MIIQTDEKYIDELAKLRILQQKDDWQEEYSGADAELFVKTKQFLEQHLNQDLIMLAEVRDNIIIATCGIQFLQVMPQCCDNGQYGYLCNVYTRSEYRNQGIQTKLLAELVAFIKSKKLQKVYLSADNPSALRIYQKFGFKKDNWSYKWIVK